MARLTRRQRGIAWFAEHAGYAMPPGRMVCARELFDAEELANANGWDVTLETEWGPDLGDHAYWCERERKHAEHEHKVYAVVLRGENSETLACIGNVIDPDRDYLRVLRAELASELL